MAEEIVHSTKACTKCGIVKPVSYEFFPHARTKPGRPQRFESKCRPCGVAQTLQRRADNPEKAKAQRRRDYVLRRHAEAEYGRAYREANKARIAQWKRDWFLSNRSVVKAYQSEWRDHNKALIRGYRTAYKAKDPNRIRILRRAQYILHHDKMLSDNRRYRMENPEAVRANVRTYRARKRSAGGVHTASDVMRQLQGQRGRCWWCQKNLTKRHVDHRIPLKRGGSNGPENIVISCPTCNQRKSARMPWELDNPRLL